MSTLTEEGVITVKNAACERLLDQRVEIKMKSKKINDCLNRFHVAMPKPRDQKERPPCIPQAVMEARAKQAAGEAERNLEEENGGAGVYSACLRKHYILANDEWKHDPIPEILDGHNVYDFVDPDILQRLEELEREEGLRMADEAEFEMDGVDLSPEEREALAEIRRKKSLLVQQHRIKKSTAESRPIVPRKFDKDSVFNSKRMGRELSRIGLHPAAAVDRARSESRGRNMERVLFDSKRIQKLLSSSQDPLAVVDRLKSKSRRWKRLRSPSGDDAGGDMDVDGDKSSNKKLRLRLRAWSRSVFGPLGPILPVRGLGSTYQIRKAIKMAKKSSQKRNKDARRGEADWTIPTLRPKHLFSGKRSTGKTYRR